ncbi:MAG: hypothetical protein AABW82_03745 [Nanoarchaeota archaeon]
MSISTKTYFNSVSVLFTIIFLFYTILSFRYDRGYGLYRLFEDAAYILAFIFVIGIIISLIVSIVKFRKRENSTQAFLLPLIPLISGALIFFSFILFDLGSINNWGIIEGMALGFSLLGFLVSSVINGVMYFYNKTP